jgi:uncharacterized membrane protein
VRGVRASREGVHASEPMTISETPVLPKLHELKKLRKPVRSVNAEHRKKLSGLERLAIWITDRVGTMGFFLVILVWTLVWLGWNTLAPSAVRFDPFPAFVLWLFLSNMIQIFLMPLIMVGQNLQGRHAESRAEADFEVNTKAEQEIEAVLLHLEAQNDLILRILRQLEGASIPQGAQAGPGSASASA